MSCAGDSPLTSSAPRPIGKRLPVRAATEIDPASNLISPNDDQRIADTILTARGVYRLFPEAVVTGDRAFEAGLRNIATEQ
jgi:hypothetical protein